MVTLLVALRIAAANPLPLVMAADAASPDLEGWWRPGELVLRSGGATASHAVRPLLGPDPVPAPRDLHAWSPVLPPTCPGPSPVRAVQGTPPSGVDLHLEGEAEALLVQLDVGGVVRAVAALGRPARACALWLVQADRLPGLEVMLAWETPDGAHRGLTVWHVPEAALPEATPPVPVDPAPSPTAPAAPQKL